VLNRISPRSQAEAWERITWKLRLPLLKTFRKIWKVNLRIDEAELNRGFYFCEFCAFLRLKPIGEKQGGI